MTNNTAESLLSEDAQREANSFQQSRRTAGGSATASSAYISRIHSLVLVLGAVIFVLGATLVYLVYRSPVSHAVLPTTTTVTSPDVTAATMAIIVAKADITQGLQILPEHLAIEKVAFSEDYKDLFSNADVSSLVGQYAKVPMLANSPIRQDSVSLLPTQGVPFKIPAGYRATTIAIDGRTGVEGFAKPGTFVDILWYYSETSGKQRVVTLVPRAKVLSVGGATESGAPDIEQQQALGSMATILVTKKQAHSIELARNLGVLSLSLVGEEEELPGQDLEVTVSDILRPDAKKSAVDGVVISANPVTGRQEKFVLKNRGWVDGQREEGIPLMRARFRRRFANQAPTKAVPRKAPVQNQKYIQVR